MSAVQRALHREHDLSGGRHTVLENAVDMTLVAKTAREAARRYELYFSGSLLAF